ncbi:MAG TPA: hypothetical protein PL196_08460 [Burkholderiaceae bacterium]|nr:hypothetical protein [Burkholderiaceae bacterium]
MPSKTPDRKRPRKSALMERRSPLPQGSDDPAGTLRKVKDALKRPIGLERRGGQLRVVLVERRHTAPADQPPVLARILVDIRERLEDLIDTPAERLMRHIGLVAGELERHGWSRVGALPASVLGRALTQADMLSSEAPSEHLNIFIERLRQLEAAAAQREERMSTRQRQLDDTKLVVEEATFEEFEASQRIWEDSLTAALEPGPAHPSSQN